MQQQASGTFELHRPDDIVFKGGFGLVRGELGDLLAHTADLHYHEHSQFGQLKFDRRRKSYLLGRLAAKQAVGALTGIQRMDTIWIDSGVFTHPVVKLEGHPNIGTSISHCNTLGIALAYPEAHPLGVDLELIDEARLDILEKHSTERERQFFAALGYNKPISYTILWTIKESLSKALRTGLTVDLKLLEIKSLIPSASFVQGEYTYFGQYKFFASYSDTYAVAVVLPKKTKTDLASFWEAFQRIA